MLSQDLMLGGREFHNEVDVEAKVLFETESNYTFLFFHYGCVRCHCFLSFPQAFLIRYLTPTSRVILRGRCCCYFADGRLVAVDF